MSFDEKYFSTHTYAEISFAKFSQYWWSNRFYAILARRYGKRGTLLLEIGCGLGHLVGQLQDTLKTYAIDVNHWALVQAKVTASHTRLQVGCAEAIPYTEGTFDVVIIKHVVEHLLHPEKALAELGRVLAPAGILIFSTPNLDSLLRPCKGKRWIGYQDPTHVALKPPSEWLSMIEAAGMRIRRTFADGFWDVPYISFVPKQIQKVAFGALGGFQALTGFIFLPMRWGESLIVIAQKTCSPGTR